MENMKEPYQKMVETIMQSGGSEKVKQNFNAEKMLSIFNAYYLKKSYDPDCKVAYIFEHFPREIVYALDMLVMDLESMAALLAKGKRVDVFLKEADKHMVTRDACSVLRSMLGVAHAGLYPKPEVIFTSNHPCNGYYKVVQQVAKIYEQKNLFEFMVPNEITPANIEFLSNQLKDIIKQIEEKTGNKFYEEKFNEAIDASNEARDYFQATAELLKDNTIEGLPNALMQISSISPWGTKEIVKICKKLKEEAFAAERKPITKPRAIWIGQIPYHGNLLIQYLEETFEILYRPSLADLDFRIDKENPFDSISLNLIRSTWNPNRISESILKLGKDYHVKHVILQNPWGCRNFIGINNIIRDQLRKNKMKVLVIDNDFMDETKVSFAHVKNRIDAFIEINGEGAMI